jgi:hypothetical protein
MTFMTKIVLTMAALAGVFTPLRSALAQPAYIYDGSIVARDSALSCFGKTVADEDLIIRNSLHGLTNSSTSKAITVLCPLNRRNVSNYGVQGRTDAVAMTAARIFVSNASTSTPIKCQVFMWLGLANASRTTAIVSASSTGFTTIGFPSPPFAPINDAGGVINIGYQCTLPKDGAGNNYLIGAEAVFNSAQP